MFPTPSKAAALAAFVAAAMLLPWAAAAQEEWEFELHPYAVRSAKVRSALLATQGGDPGKAARLIDEAKELSEPVRNYWAGRLLLAAGKSRKASKRLRAVVNGDSVLVPLAALELGRMALQKERWGEAEEVLEVAAQHPAWCSEAQQGLALAYGRENNLEAAGAAFRSAMECTPELEARRDAVLHRSPLGGENPCRLRLLHQAYFKSDPDREVVAALRAHWGEEFSDLELLRTLVRGSRSTWRRELERLGDDQSFAREMLTGLIVKQRRRQKKAAALPHFDHAEQLASTGLREGMAEYFHGRTLESLDRDLEANDIYQELLLRHPDFPLARRIATRIGEIALREGQPLQGIAAISSFLGTSCPGEDLSEALHLAAFTSYLAGDWEGARAQWERLARTHFFTAQSPWVNWGPLALFWQAKALLGAGRNEAAIELLTQVSRVFPGDYYGVLAGYRLRQLGVDVAAPAAARWDVSPVTLARQGELPASYGAVVELFRMGFWQEAHDAARRLVGLGIVGPTSGDLLLSSYVRANSMRSAISYRRALGMNPAPWRQGARMWLSSLSFAYGDAVSHGHQQSGLAPALIAAIIRFESNYNTGSQSHAGAIGLLQVKRNTGNNVAVPCLGRKPVSGRELRDPMLNLELGSIYIAELVHRHHDNWAIALAAYNAGPGTASWWLERFAGLNSDAFVEQITYPNTVGYVKRILGVTPIYWSLFYPILGSAPVSPELPLTVPEDTLPFLDESGGRCAPRSDNS